MLTKESPSPAMGGEKPLVLVVDDEYGLRESIARSLAKEFSVDIAGHASEAVAKIREKTYGAIVLGVRWPGMEGIKAMNDLHEIDSDVAVIVLAGRSHPGAVAPSEMAGASQCLPQPPDIPELIEAVRKQTQATRVRRQQARINHDIQQLNLALKREIAENEPHIWQARASVELVHDLNNPLTVVIGYAALLVEEAKAVAAVDPERGKKLLDYAAMVERASEYCHHLSENWRQASRKSSEFATLDLVQVAHEVRQVVFFGNAAIQLQGITTATVRGSKYELMRIFQNVFKNSLEAGATRLCVAFAREGRNHEVTIRDNGTGMMPEAVKKALGGGFSNKESGTGMGLSICRHLLGIHGAALKMESKPGQGTTVVLIFPAADS